MARGAGIVEGWPAVGWVAGTGFALLATASFFLARVLLTRRRARHETYRATPTAESDDSFRCAMLAIAWVLHQLVYLGTYLELVRWRRGGRSPTLQFDLYVWVLLVAVSAIVGAVASAIGERRN